MVHGGPNLRRHCLIDDSVLRQLEAATAFAPLHNPPALSVIRFAQEHFPELPQVACFDTVFHAGMPDVARTLPIPLNCDRTASNATDFMAFPASRSCVNSGTIGRIGSSLRISAMAPVSPPLKTVKSIDTSMGLTPTGGVIMGTRCGDLDPGVLVYLMREKELRRCRDSKTFVDHHSGLLGISGIDGDMRRLHEASASNADARLAIQMFCYSIRKQVAAMIAALDGVDLLVFTGGIGEHDAEVRAEICERSVVAWCQPRPGTKSIFGRPHQRSNIALCCPRTPLGRGRSDRHPYLGARRLLVATGHQSTERHRLNNWARRNTNCHSTA